MHWLRGGVSEDADVAVVEFDRQRGSTTSAVTV
jgi:hypothetical protein